MQRNNFSLATYVCFVAGLQRSTAILISETFVDADEASDVQLLQTLFLISDFSPLDLLRTPYG